jgi:hypothetical protein
LTFGVLVFSDCSQAIPPLLPYLGVTLTDLTFIDEGNPDLVSLALARDLCYMELTQLRYKG